VRLSPARGALVVAGRELAAACDSSIAWVATIAALLALSSVFMNEFFLAGKLDMQPLFDLLPLLFVLYMPALSMRTWSEDLRSRTFELWMTLPLPPGAVVAGKYLASLALLLLFLAGTLPVVLLLVALGEPDLGRIASGYAGAFLLGATLLALGSLCSALTSDQIVAFLAAAFGAFLLVFLGEERVVAVLDGAAPGWRLGSFLSDHVSALPPYEGFVRGSLGLGALAWFAGLALLLLGFTTLAVRRNRA
jgi:ABC-2 type transport system permease protein